MLRALFVSTILLVASCLPSALQIQIRAANDVAVAANQILPVLVDAYRREGLTAIAAAADRPAAELALEAVRQRWRRVWGTDDTGHDCPSPSGRDCINGAWPALREADDAWASALELQVSGRQIDLETAAHLAGDLRSSYCDLRSAIPSGVHLPNLPSAASCNNSGGGVP